MLSQSAHVLGVWSGPNGASPRSPATIRSVWEDMAQQAGSLSLAAVTALVTTLMVEYLAKPRLDARKERLLRDRRQIDQVVFGLQKLGLHMGYCWT